MRTIILLGLALTAASASAQTDSQLRYVCKDFVERQLHDPRDAQLDWTKGRVSKNPKTGLYTIRFPGRAKNAYGALRLATFECVVRHQGGDNFSAVTVRVTD